jgi:hypothetical protein
MPKFLFWNLGGREIVPLVRLIADTHDVDMIVLAELPGLPARAQALLNSGSGEFRLAFGRCRRVHFFTRFDDGFLVPLVDTDRYSIRRLRLPARQEILVVGAHLPSQMHSTVGDIAQECRLLSGHIRRIEASVGHSRTVLLGDLNLNPFDEGLVQTAGLHAVGSRRTALRRSRVVDECAYSFFYNPMWAHLGDRDGDFAGTYFYKGSGHATFFWNIFDHVLLRPDLIQAFSHDQVQIITTAGVHKLIRPNGRPNPTIGSDHLPVLLQLDF